MSGKYSSVEVLHPEVNDFHRSSNKLSRNKDLKQVIRNLHAAYVSMKGFQHSDGDLCKSDTYLNKFSNIIREKHSPNPVSRNSLPLSEKAINHRSKSRRYSQQKYDHVGLAYRNYRNSEESDKESLLFTNQENRKTGLWVSKLFHREISLQSEKMQSCSSNYNSLNFRGNSSPQASANNYTQWSVLPTKNTNAEEMSRSVGKKKRDKTREMSSNQNEKFGATFKQKKVGKPEVIYCPSNITEQTLGHNGEAKLIKSGDVRQVVIKGLKNDTINEEDRQATRNTRKNASGSQAESKKHSKSKKKKTAHDNINIQENKISKEVELPRKSKEKHQYFHRNVEVESSQEESSDDHNYERHHESKKREKNRKHKRNVAEDELVQREKLDEFKTHGNRDYLTERSSKKAARERTLRRSRGSNEELESDREARSRNLHRQKSDSSNSREHRSRHHHHHHSSSRKHRNRHLELKHIDSYDSFRTHSDIDAQGYKYKRKNSSIEQCKCCKCRSHIQREEEGPSKRYSRHQRSHSLPQKWQYKQRPVETSERHVHKPRHHRWDCDEEVCECHHCNSRESLRKRRDGELMDVLSEVCSELSNRLCDEAPYPSRKAHRSHRRLDLARYLSPDTLQLLDSMDYQNSRPTHRVFKDFTSGLPPPAPRRQPSAIECDKVPWNESPAHGKPKSKSGTMLNTPMVNTYPVYCAVPQPIPVPVQAPTSNQNWYPQPNNMLIRPGMLPYSQPHQVPNAPTAVNPFMQPGIPNSAIQSGMLVPNMTYCQRF